MKLALAFLFTALLTLASAQQNGRWRFKLRATTYRGFTPFLSGYINVDSAGRAVFSSDFQGFVSVSATSFQVLRALLTMTQYMDNALPNGELPVGELFREDNGAQAYLVPTSTANLYDAYFGTVPTYVSALSTDFAITVLNCGGHCGGLQIVYGGSGAQWLAYPDDTVANVWRVSFHGFRDAIGTQELMLRRFVIGTAKGLGQPEDMESGCGGMPFDIAVLWWNDGRGLEVAEYSSIYEWRCFVSRAAGCE